MEDSILTMRGAAHDIRGFLASASLATEYLSEHDDFRIATRAARISKAIDQVVSICQTDLAGFNSPGETVRLSSNDIEALLSQISILAGSRNANRPGGRDVSIFVAEDVKLECNHAHLFRVIFNLTINAVRAVRDHGGTGVDLRVARLGSEIRFSVCDDGPGLPAHILDHLYPRIDRPAPTGKRIGFGLMAAVLLANEMSGYLQLSHTSECGTEFCFTLPAKPI